MRVLVAPDAFKESLSAGEAAEAIARGVREALPDAEIDLCPLADGGEGTLDALLAARGGERRRARVCGPLGEPRDADWALLEGGGAVVELAEAAGLGLVPRARRDPTRTTTYGVGELVRAALDAGAREVLLGIGGSASCDGGSGLAQALGVRFAGGVEPMTGGALQGLRAIDTRGRDPRLRETPLRVACDVRNPLTGPRGAAAVYAPQKGATPAQVQALEAGLAQLARLLPGADPDAPGSGAAGGVGFGAAAMLGARLASGIDLVLAALGFAERVRAADCVLTGEGRLDAQSFEGKAVVGVARAARAAGVPAIALAGALAGDLAPLRREGLVAWHALTPGVELEAAMRRAAPLLAALARDVVRGL